MRTVAVPTIAELARRGTPFAGLLYIGLALTSAGPRVVEFNARFGDPETQVVLALLDSPLGALLHAAGSRAGSPQVPPLQWRAGAAVTVVLAAAGYPGTPRAGDVITGAEQPGVLHAGTRRRDDGAIVSAGGRVLCATAVGADLAAARAARLRADGPRRAARRPVPHRHRFPGEPPTLSRCPATTIRRPSRTRRSTSSSGRIRSPGRRRARCRRRPRDPRRPRRSVTKSRSPSRPVPDWLRRRGTLAGGAVVLIAAALIARAVSSHHHHPRRRTRRRRQRLGAPAVATGSPALQYPAPAAAISGCTYKLQSATVRTLPDAATAALMSALPGIRVTASSTQLGHSATSGPCVLQRVVVASLAGVSVQVDVRAKAAGDATAAARSVGGTTETFRVTVVVGARAVDVTAVQPLGAAGSPAIATRSLQKLAADPRLIAA